MRPTKSIVDIKLNNRVQFQRAINARSSGLAPDEVGQNYSMQ